MKSFALGVGSVLLFSLGATAAENGTQMETFLGYTFTRVPSVQNISPFSMNGGSGQFAYNFNHWLGGVMDLGAVHNGSIHNTSLDSTLANFLAGPRLSIRHWSRVTPYVQTLFGGVYATTSTAAPELASVTDIPPGANLRAVRQQTAFAMTAGGGLDIKINKHVSFRPVQLEYFLTQLHHYRDAADDNQNSLRYSAGFNFTFGHAE